MKRITAFFLVLIFTIMSQTSVFADEEVNVFVPQLTNMFSTYYSPSEWGENDSSRAILAVSLMLDTGMEDITVGKLFELDALVNDGYISRSGVGKNNIVYVLYLYQDGNFLMTSYKPSLGQAKYTIMTNVSRNVMKAAVEAQNSWKLDTGFVDLACDMIMEMMNG